MNSPKVSVTIPVYNGAKTLKQCIESVLKQTYNNYEVIVIDNNSDDSTKDIICGLKKKDGRIIYVFEPKKGRGAARNAGIIRASGEIILMTDSDCVVPQNWISELIKPILGENESAVMGFEEDKTKNFWSENYQKAELEYYKSHLHGKHINAVDTKNFAIKSSLIKKLMFDPELNSVVDFDLYLRLKKVSKIRCLDYVKVGHYHKNSMKKVIELNFRRAFWTSKVYKKYEKTDKPQFKTISFYNIATFPFWIIMQFIKKNPGEAYFLLISKISWGTGLLWGYLKS